VDTSYEALHGSVVNEYSFRVSPSTPTDNIECRMEYPPLGLTQRETAKVISISKPYSYLIL